MTGVRAMIALVATSICAVAAALAQDAAPANTLMDLQRQFGACMGGKPLGPAGSRLTIMLMMKRDGSIFGKPRITFSHLEGDADARQRFVDDVGARRQSLFALQDNAVARRRDRRPPVCHYSGAVKAGAKNLAPLAAETPGHAPDGPAPIT